MAANIQSLTALRGIAALTVLAYHCAEQLAGAGRVPLPLRHGYLAVDLFFLLSGFVLMHVHEREFADGVDWARVGSFLRARFARTYPVHLLMLLLLLPLLGTRPDFSGAALVQSLMLTQGPWLHAACWNVPAWSVSAEWHAYLLFPFLVMPWQGRSRRITAAVLLLCLATLSLTVLASDGGANIYYAPAVLLRSLPEFIAGMGIYRLYRDGWLRGWFARDSAIAVAAAAAIGLASFSGADAAVVAALGLLLLSAAHNRGRAARWLATRVPTYLGRISYSLYMVQAVAADAAFMVARPWLASHEASAAIGAGAMLVLSFAFAIPVSRYVEYPLRDLLRGRARATA